MTIRAATKLAMVATGALALTGCATTLRTPPAEAIRYHLGAQQVTRGTVAVEALGATPGVPVSLEFQAYAAAVERELLANGYTRAAPGTTPQYVASVGFRRGTELGPPRQSPFSIGLGVGGGGFGRRSAVGGGLGVGFPIGGGGQTQLVVSELQVTIKRRADLSPLWEGSARAAADARSGDAATDALAARLARALFTGFPGESGRTIEVR
jgi:hypothetical protein